MINPLTTYGTTIHCEMHWVTRGFRGKAESSKRIIRCRASRMGGNGHGGIRLNTTCSTLFFLCYSSSGPLSFVLAFSGDLRLVPRCVMPPHPSVGFPLSPTSCSTLRYCFVYVCTCAVFMGPPRDSAFSVDKAGLFCES